LVHNAAGRHPEEFADLGDTHRLADMLRRAEQGTLGGHVPQPSERFGARVYFSGKRVLVKLTRRS
jgi:hypothetical protein